MGEIAHSLDLNWGLLATQAIGFILTVWILKAFAWKPLLKMLEDRKNKIAGDIGDAFIGLVPVVLGAVALTAAVRVAGLTAERPVRRSARACGGSGA